MQTINWGELGCRLIRVLGFSKKGWMARGCYQRQLFKETGENVLGLSGMIAKAVNESESQLAFYKPTYQMMGGANNLGMLIHNCSNGFSYLSKIESCPLANREFVFLKWQKNNLSPKDYIAPDFLGCFKIPETHYCVLTMELLSVPKVYSVERVIELYQRMNSLTPFIVECGGVSKADGLFHFELEANTKITMVIQKIVSKLHHQSGYENLKLYLSERSAVFEERVDDYQSILNFFAESSSLTNTFDIDKHYGFLHGDFKKSNILSSENGELRIIDLQYYQYGCRLWDMAFFISKEKDGFLKSYFKFIKPLNLDLEQHRLFVVLYIVAVLLHVKKSNLSKILKNNVRPAIEHYYQVEAKYL